MSDLKTEVQIGNEVMEEGIGKTVDGDTLSYNFKYFRIKFGGIKEPIDFWSQVAMLGFLAPAVALHEIGHVIGTTLVTYGYCWAGLDTFKSPTWIFWGAPAMNAAMTGLGATAFLFSLVNLSFWGMAASAYWFVANLAAFASSEHDINYKEAEVYTENEVLKDFYESRDELYNKHHGDEQ